MEVRTDMETKLSTTRKSLADTLLIQNTIAQNLKKLNSESDQINQSVAQTRSLSQNFIEQLVLLEQILTAHLTVGECQPSKGTNMLVTSTRNTLQ
jgi:hypothetical protein